MFGKYKQSITNILTESYYNKKKFKNNFTTLMGALKPNKSSREFFTLYGEIEKKTFNDKQIAEQYLNDVIKNLKSRKPTLKLNYLKEAIENCGKVSKPNSTYQRLDKLVFSNSVTRIEDRIKAKNDLLENLLRKDKNVGLPKIKNNVVKKLAIKKFNERYSTLDESTQKELKKLLSLSKKELSKLYENTQHTTIETLESLVSKAETDKIKDKLGETLKLVKESPSNRTNLIKLNKLSKDLIS
tara:strand:- start:3190 stop:3915 length:726 start_codon:yes stop_codon:yes gene_type:complete